MKKLFSILFCAILLTSCLSAQALSPVQVVLDCLEVSFDQEPIIENDRTLVPVRAIFEAMGATVDWNQETKTVTSSLDGTTVVMVVDNKNMTVNGAFKTLDVPPKIIGERTLVPARAVAEGFGGTVTWDASERTVIIQSKAFLQKVDNQKEFSSVKKLTQDDKIAVSAFSTSYFDGYNTVTNTADGTAIALRHTTKTGHASLEIRADIYTGEDASFTDEYVKSVANTMVSVVSGDLISSGVVLISGMAFMKIHYTAPRTVYGITDYDPDITVYMGRRNGVVYTATLSVYGEVERTVIGDFLYTINSLLIA